VTVRNRGFFIPILVQNDKNAQRESMGNFLYQKKARTRLGSITARSLTGAKKEKLKGYVLY